MKTTTSSEVAGWLGEYVRDRDRGPTLTETFGDVIGTAASSTRLLDVSAMHATFPPMTIRSKPTLKLALILLSVDVP